jgi:hypothetical protein
MAEKDGTNRAQRAVYGLVGFGRRAAAFTLRPFSGLAGMALEAGIELERRAVDGCSSTARSWSRSSWLPSTVRGSSRR